MISLVVATKDRVEPLMRLLDSLHQQTSSAFEVLIVDQNSDDRLENVVRRTETQLQLRHLRCEPGASRARNLGARHARGEILGFPDDDCWYATDLVARVAGWFLAKPEVAGLCGRPHDPDAHRDVFGLTPTARQIQPPLVTKTVAASALFVRCPAFLDVGGFDELMGPGADTPFGGMEEHELVLRLLGSEERMEFDPAFVVYHPLIGQSITPAKARGYAGGMARVLTLYPTLRPTVATRMMRSVAGTVLRASQFRFSDARNHWNAVIGYWRGYQATRQEIGR